MYKVITFLVLVLLAIISKMYSMTLFITLLLISIIICGFIWIVSEKDLRTRLLEALKIRFTDACVRDENPFTFDPESYMGMYVSPIEPIGAVKNFLTDFFGRLGYECCAVPETRASSNSNRFLVKKGNSTTLHVALDLVQNNHAEEYHIHITPFSNEP
jgi:uncharacterized membrane protein